MPIVDFDTECWSDPWIQERSPLGKLLFVYLWTNTHRNISGLYVITKKTIADETGLTRKQVDDLLQELDPKVKYDPVHSVCWVVKHARRQFLRGEKISPKQKEGIRRHVLKLRWHPFFRDFADAYPEIFLPGEADTLSKGINTLSKGMDTLGGGGGGKGKGKDEEIGDRGAGEEEKEEGKAKLTPDLFASLYNELCPNLPRSLKLSSDRRKDINARIKEYPDIEWWKAVFLKANEVDLPPNEKHPNGWRPDLEFLVRNSDNCVKVLEGKYDQGRKPHKQYGAESLLKKVLQEEADEEARQESIHRGAGEDGGSGGRIPIGSKN